MTQPGDVPTQGGRLAPRPKSAFRLRRPVVILAVISFIGAAGFFGVSHLKTRAREIVDDTLPGISAAVEANANMAQAFNCTMMLLMADNEPLRVEISGRIEGFNRRTAECLDAYERSIYQPEDRRQFEECIRYRAAYLEIRKRVIALSESQRHENAVIVLQTELLPAFQKYSRATRQMAEYNVRQGQVRGETITYVCRITRWTMAGIVTLVFILGFLFGLHK